MFAWYTCCGAEAGSETLLKPLHETIRRHEESVALLTARQTTLYRSYITERAAWQSDVAKNRASAESAAATIEALQAKVAALEEGLRMLDDKVQLCSPRDVARCVAGCIVVVVYSGLALRVPCNQGVATLSL